MYHATLVGAAAPALWATLPLLSTSVAEVPPLQTMATAFALASAGAAAWAVRRGAGLAAGFRASPAAWAIGVYGLFGWHLCYFLAVRYAPVTEASLINYLWPLLLVIFSGLLPGERLGWRPIAGACAGLVGAMLLVTDGGTVAFKGQYALGYALALACAAIWSSYSLLNRRFAKDVPTLAVGGFCAVTALLAFAGHLALERPAAPSLQAWAALAGLGLGPLGFAFFAWDYGVKRGDIRILGALGYLTPLLATALLVAAGRAPATWTLAVACCCVAGGAAIAARDFRRAERNPRSPSIDRQTGRPT